MPNAALIFNPMSGRRRGSAWAVRVVEALASQGWSLRSEPTDAPGAATAMARCLADRGDLDAVFALGGDGTLREVAIGLMGTKVALGPLPGGTTNVLVRSLGLPANPVAAARRLALGARASWRVGLCGSTPFLMMVSAGFDAEVVARMDGKAKARWGRGAVALSGLGVWWRYPFPVLEVRTGEEQFRSYFVAVNNVRLYGGAFVLAPEADPSAATLELVSQSAPGRVAALGFARDLAFGRHLRRRDVVHRRVEVVDLSGPPEVALQVDGDRCTERLPVRIGLAEERLEILVG